MTISNKDRRKAYKFLSRLVRQGLTPQDLSEARAIPRLTEWLEDGEVDYDSLAADHYQLFGMNVFPNESVYLSLESQLGGLVTQNVITTYAKLGFTPLDANENPDHLGVELECLASLCESGKEADARMFLDTHLMRWLPIFILAVRQQGSGFFADVVEQIFSLVLEYHEDLDSLKEPAHLALPPNPLLLEQDKTGLREIASFLLTPVYSGFFLSREDISSLGQARRVPRGFGSRLQMLTNLLRSAADFDQISAILDDLQSMVKTWQEDYQEIGAKNPTAKTIVEAWGTRLKQTSEILEKVFLATSQ